MFPGCSQNHTAVLASGDFRIFIQVLTWGGWGSNPRPADYENSGPVHRTHYLHGYHGVTPLVVLIAPFARMARSTNRSTAEAPVPLVLLLCVT